MEIVSIEHECQVKCRRKMFDESSGSESEDRSTRGLHGSARCTPLPWEEAIQLDEEEVQLQLKESSHKLKIKDSELKKEPEQELLAKIKTSFAEAKANCARATMELVEATSEGEELRRNLALLGRHVDAANKQAEQLREAEASAVAYRMKLESVARKNQRWESSQDPFASKQQQSVEIRAADKLVSTLQKRNEKMRGHVNKLKLQSVQCDLELRMKRHEVIELMGEVSFALKVKRSRKEELVNLRASVRRSLCGIHCEKDDSHQGSGASRRELDVSERSTEKKQHPTENKTPSILKNPNWTETNTHPTETMAHSAETKVYPTETKANPATKKAYPPEKKSYSAEKKSYSAEKKAYPTENKRHTGDLAEQAPPMKSSHPRPIKIGETRRNPMNQTRQQALLQTRAAPNKRGHASTLDRRGRSVGWAKKMLLCSPKKESECRLNVRSCTPSFPLLCHKKEPLEGFDKVPLRRVATDVAISSSSWKNDVPWY